MSDDIVGRINETIANIDRAVGQREPPSSEELWKIIWKLVSDFDTVLDKLQRLQMEVESARLDIKDLRLDFQKRDLTNQFVQLPTASDKPQ
jgi:hypothetical protein